MKGSFPLLVPLRYQRAWNRRQWLVPRGRASRLPSSVDSTDPERSRAKPLIRTFHWLPLVPPSRPLPSSRDV